MTKQNILWPLITVLFFIGMFALLAVNRDAAPDSSSYSASLLSAAEDKFDFGMIHMGNGDVSHEFKVENNGTEAVTIRKVYTSCMCTSAYIIDSSGKKHGRFGMPGHGLPSRTNVKVNPGESISVEAIFDPAAHGPSGVGLAERSIYLETNSAKTPKVELEFVAMVIK